MEQYALNHRDHLKYNFYHNIFAGAMLYRKKRGFFQNMSKLVDRPSKNCKSKFQKIERKIYVTLIGFPSDHYKLFLFIRRGHRLDWNLNLSEFGNLRISKPFDGSMKKQSISILKKRVFEEKHLYQNNTESLALKYEWLRYDLFRTFKRKCIETQNLGRKASTRSRLFIDWLGGKSQFTQLIIQSILVHSHTPNNQRQVRRHFMLDRSKKNMVKTDSNQILSAEQQLKKVCFFYFFSIIKKKKPKSLEIWCSSTLKNKDLDQILKYPGPLKYTNWNKLPMIKRRLSKNSKLKCPEDCQKETTSQTFFGKNKFLEKRSLSKSFLREKIFTKKKSIEDSN